MCCQKKRNLLTEDTTSHGEKKKERKKRKKKIGVEYRIRELWLDSLMVLPPTLQRHELAISIHATFMYPTARLPPHFRCSRQRCKKDKQSPKLFSPDNMDPGSVPVQQQMHDQINWKKESYRLSSACGDPRNQTNVLPVDAHVWRQLNLSAVARCSDSYCIFLSLSIGRFIPGIFHTGVHRCK